MDTLAMYIGYVVIVIVCLIVLLMAIDIDYTKDEFFMFKVFAFGFINVRNTNTKLIDNLGRVRKNKNAGIKIGKGTFYVTSPTWFNQHIWNIGGVK